MPTGRRVHAVVFIVSICCVVVARAGNIRPFLLEPARLTKARPVQAVTDFCTTVIWNLGTPEFLYEFMKHMNSYMKKSYEFICYLNSYMNSYMK